MSMPITGETLASPATRIESESEHQGVITDKETGRKTSVTIVSRKVKITQPEPESASSLQNRTTQEVEISDFALSVLHDEMSSLSNLTECLQSESFTKAVDLIMSCQGLVIVLGLGKSGIIGKKAAATFTSTGTRSIYMHATEAGHGDLGTMTSNDIVLLISNSGETKEAVALIECLKLKNIPIVSITSKPQSTLARESQVHLCTGVLQEAGELKLAPTSSTTATLVLTDCLAMTLSKMKGFTAKDFALSHPSGSLGKKATSTS